MEQEKLSFTSINLGYSKLCNYALLILVGLGAAMNAISVVDESVSYIGAIGGILALLFWRYLMNKINISTGDKVLSNRIFYAFAFDLASSVIECIAAFTSVEWLVFIGTILSIPAFIYYCMIIARCIKAGDSQVKMFGKLMLWTGVAIIILLSIIIIVVVFIGEIKPGIIVPVSLLSAYCFVYPFTYFINTVEKLK